MTEHDRKNIYERRRNLVYLIAEYVKEAGLHKTHTTLIDEAQLSNEFAVCDNVDLEAIYLEFCSYFYIKFGKKPRFVKRVEGAAAAASAITSAKPASISSLGSMDSASGRRALSKRRANMASKMAPEIMTIFPELPVKDLLTCHAIPSLASSSPSDPIEQINIPGFFTKPMNEFYKSHPSEWRELTEGIFKDIVQKDLCVKFEDITGQDDAKMIIQESVIFPMRYPQLFHRVQPWKAVLLHGVPGVGKTLLAKALCSETHESFTFFNIAASTLISKWRGESEKLIRVLFELAKFHAPSIIFIDELDSLTSKRNSTEHEASKRLKNDFLSLLDGLASDDASDGKVFVLGSTNMPWEIDQAFIRRFERKILIDVPTFHDRLSLIKQFLPSAQFWREEDLEELALLSENFTGDDIRVAIKEANMKIIRKKIRNQLNESSSMSFCDLDVEFHHLKDSLKQVKANPDNDISKHRQWNSSMAKS